jgi:nickel transport protein
MQLQFTKRATWVLLLFLTIFPVSATISAGTAESPPGGQVSPPSQIASSSGDSQMALGNCERIGVMLEEQKQFLSGEIGRVRREMAMLRQELSTPGLRDIVAGIGYVFGLTGIALYFQSRKGGQRR